ncbi:MAG: gliding motility-associated C-terminal domain-containing protein [Bacteroidetes bacterium]|nr:gliding motility-associated C-terminal domain-containing protein [Bacteroidota bacterium]
MKKLTLLLAFSAFLLAQKSFAQPTFFFSPEQTQVDVGDPVCLALKVNDFTDILSVQFTITFNPGVVQYTGVNGFNPLVTGLDIADFGTTNAGLGYITFNWSNGLPCQTATTGVTIPDGSILFNLCFLATGDYGFHTPVDITDSPMDLIVRRVAANCIDIGAFPIGGFISIGTSPLTINISSGDGFTNDIVCIDFKVENFNNLISTQYFIFWDTAILEFQSVMKMNLPGNYFVNPSPAFGMLSSIWYTNDITVGVDVPDGTQILQMCFKIKGQCGQSSPIYISENMNSSPVEPIEIIDAITGASPLGVSIGLLQEEGEVTVKCFNPNGITLNIQDKNVCPGQSFTVDVTVEDFTIVSKMMFNLKWNPGVIDFQQVTFPPQPGGPSCTPFSNGVNTSQTPNGILQMDWEQFSLGCNKPDGYIVMRLHFIANGPSGSNTTIAVVNPILVDKFGGLVVDVGINNHNGFVTLCDLDQPTIVAGSIDANPGQTVCIDFTVQDFDDLTGTQFTIVWEPTILQYAGVQGFNLTNLSIDNFLQDQAPTIGVLGVEWENATGVSVPDGTAIFQVCFQLIGDPGDCSIITFDEVPWPIDINAEANGTLDIGMNGQPGQICTQNPFSFNVALPDIYAGQFANVCLDVTVQNFNQLTNTEYSINWDPEILEYASIQLTGALAGFGPASYDESFSLTSNGQLISDWAALNQVIGTTVPNGTSIFQICFTVIGSSGECSPVTITDYPMPIEINSATTGPANLGLVTDAGSVCVSGTISLVSYNIVDVWCGGNPTGGIDLTIAGGSGQYVYNWTGPGVNPTAPDQTGLDVGTYAVTVTDLLNPTLVVSQQFQVEYTPDATFAEAGQDTTFTCDNFFMTLNGCGSTSGPGITYLWQSIVGAGLVIPGQQNMCNPQVIGGQCYRLTVTDSVTGCVDRDTVCIATAFKAIPEAGEPDTLTCIQTTVTLNGSDPPLGFDLEWTGPGIQPGEENSQTPTVNAGGWYFISFTNPLTNCVGIDSVFVEDNIIDPVADAGSDVPIGCDDPSVPIGGASSTGANISYEWSPVGPGQLCGNTQMPTTNACSPGTYQLLVTNASNGCSAMDLVEVVGDTIKPVADAGPDFAINCTVSQVTLDGSGSSGNGNYSYTWTELPSGNVVAQGTLTPVISTPGNYQLEVINNGNGCKAYSEVEVKDSTQLPDVVGVASNPITCYLTNSTLDAAGSSAGAEFTYTWKNSAGATVGMGQTVVVSQPDTFQLVVTNTSNNCVDSVAVGVADNDDPPFVNAGLDDFINCFGDPTLNGQADVAINPNLIVQWSTPMGNCIQNGSTLTPTVSCPGTYTLTVQDTVTGCVDSGQTTVAPDTTLPSASAGSDVTLTCSEDTIALQGSTDASNFTVQWGSIPSNLPMGDATTLNPTVTVAGTYTLIVTSSVNGCTSTADLVVVDSNKIKPVADAGADDSTDCQNLTGTLDASGSTLTGTTIQWQQIIGGIFTSGNPTINVPAGTYEVIVTSTLNGCEARDTAAVIDIAVLPEVVVDSTVEIGCDGAPSLLDGTGSESGNGISYLWTNSATGAIVGSSLVVPVSIVGTYILTVSNSNNNCTATADVEVTQTINGEPATAMADYTDCDPQAMLVGNLPQGATGEWTSSTGAVIADPTAQTTLAGNLQVGDNVFTWTLSLGNCEDYSSADVVVNVGQAAPNAVNDNTSLLPGTGGQVTFNVLANDNFTAGNTSFNLLNSTIFGVVSATDSGDVTFAKEKCFAGNIEIPYQLCDLTCLDLCDTASLTILVEQDPAEQCDEVPNGVTPNGDGLNDELVFDILLNNSEDKFPDNEIIIFNRWGDVVYHSKPYTNNWQGTNDKGDDLPQGTYYYILRLNIADGEIIRGDVTLLK